MSRRTERVAERIRQELGLHIPELRHPDVGFVTVTGVDVSPDLRIAWVKISFLPTRSAEDPERSLAALSRSAGFLQVKIAPSLGLRAAPELRFQPDRSVERAAEISDLIRQARASDRHASDEEGASEGDPHGGGTTGTEL